MEELKLLDFDSLIFSKKIARFSGKSLSLDTAKAIKKECIDSGIDCVYFDLDINDFNSLNIAIKEGYLLTDVKITFQRKLKNPMEVFGPAEGFEITDIIKDADHEELEELSVELSETSRFAFDPNFKIKGVHKLYRKWMQNSLNGSAADQVFTAKDARLQKTIGVVTCKNKSGYGEIVLIVINDKYKGMNLGSALLNKSFNYFASQGIFEARVTTHGRTIDAQRFYQKNGFLSYSAAVSFDAWIK